MISFDLGFLNSNFFAGAATISTGLIAYLVFYFQKSNYKTQAARVLLTEIRTAEEKIEQIREKVVAGSVQDLPSVLSTNSWKLYAPLFISDFDQDELRILNNFYNCADKIEEFAKRDNDYFWLNTEERARATVQQTAKFSEDAVSKFIDNKLARDTYVRESMIEFGRLLDEHNSPYSPKKTIEGIKNLITKIPSITTSSCGTKLKKLAGLK